MKNHFVLVFIFLFSKTVLCQIPIINDIGLKEIYANDSNGIIDSTKIDSVEIGLKVDHIDRIKSLYFTFGFKDTCKNTIISRYIELVSLNNRITINSIYSARYYLTDNIIRIVYPINDSIRSMLVDNKMSIEEINYMHVQLFETETYSYSKIYYYKDCEKYNKLPPCKISLTEINKYIGMTVTIQGKIDYVEQFDNISYLYVGEKYSSNILTVSINLSNGAFNDQNLNSYLGEKVEITGPLSFYNGVTNLIVYSPDQIKIIE